MVNADRKNNFLSESYNTVSARKNALRALNWFSELEDSTDTDICEQNVEALQRVLNNSVTARVSGSRASIYTLREYNNWCKNHGYNTTDALLEIKIDISDGIKREMFSDPVHLQDTLNTTFGSIDKNSVFLVCRGYLWLGYMGLTDVDAITVNVDDVDIKNKILRFNKSIYDIPDEAIETFNKLINLDYFDIEHNNPYYVTKKIRYPGRQLLRSFDVTSLNVERFRCYINKQNKKNNTFIFFKKVFLSGQYYRMYMAEKNGVDINTLTEKFICEDIKRRSSISERTAESKNKSDNFARLKRECIKDYRTWKSVYYYEEGIV